MNTLRSLMRPEQMQSCKAFQALYYVKRDKYEQNINARSISAYKHRKFNSFINSVILSKRTRTKFTSYLEMASFCECIALYCRDYSIGLFIEYLYGFFVTSKCLKIKFDIHGIECRFQCMIKRKFWTISNRISLQSFNLIFFIYLYLLRIERCCLYLLHSNRSF